MNMKYRYWVFLLMLAFAWNGCGLVDSKVEGERGFNGDIFVVDIESDRTTRLTFDDNIYFKARWSPDGDKISYRTHSGLFIMDIDGSNVNSIVEGTLFPNIPFYSIGYAWSPDSREIVYTDYNDDRSRVVLRKFDLISRKSEILFEGEDNRVFNFLEWSPDGEYLFISSINGGDARLIEVNSKTTEVFLPRLYTLNDIQWSPDASKIAYSTDEFINDSTTVNRTYIIDINTQDRVVINEGYDVYEIEWANSSESLLISDNYSAYIVNSKGDSRNLIPDDRFGNRIFNFEWSASDDVVYFLNSRSNQPTRFARIKKDGSGLKEFKETVGPFFNGSYSPDNTRFAYTYFSTCASCN